MATEEGIQTFGTRFWAAFKYTLGFIALVVIVFVVGFFVPVAKGQQGAHYDLDFFKRILGENRKFNSKPGFIDQADWRLHQTENGPLPSVSGC